jgi:hypothetical protein
VGRRLFPKLTWVMNLLAPYSDEKVANRHVRDFGWEMAHGAVSRRPPISLYTIVPRTGGDAHAAKVWDLSIVQEPFSVAPCPTPAFRFRPLSAPLPPRSTLVCDTHAEAKKLGYGAGGAGSARHKVVSLDGTLIAKGGTITGGISRGTEAKAAGFDRAALDGLRAQRQQCVETLQTLGSVRDRELQLQQVRG